MARALPYDAARFPPGPREPSPVQTLRFLRDPLGYGTELRNRFGPIFTLRSFGAFVSAADVDTMRQVLTDQDRFVGGGAAELLVPVVGRGSLICTEPPRHLRNRKLLLPAFHGERIALWGERIGELIDARLPELTTGDGVAVRPWAQALTLDVILRVVFGVEDHARVEQFRRALDRFMDPRLMGILFMPPIARRDLGPLSPGGAFARRRAVVDALIASEITARRATDHADRDDVLSVLLDARDEDGKGFSDAELRDELMGLVIAGHETTATALSWTLHLLAHHPATRDALIEELDAGEDTLLKATIKESTRLRPPVWDAVRQARHDTELAGKPVPGGAFVNAMFSVVHRDPELWADPEAFKPERHLDGSPVPYALTPFGGGVRRCIGAALAQLELEVALREILARAVPHPDGAQEPARLFAVTIVPAKGGRVRLAPRPTSARKPVLAATA